MAGNNTPIKRRGGRYESEVVVFLSGNIEPNDDTGQYIISSIGNVDKNTIIDVEFFGKVNNGSGVAVNLGYIIGNVTQGNTVNPQLAITDPVAMANSAPNSSFVKIRASFGIYISGITGTMDACRTTPSATEAVSVASNMLGRQQGLLAQPSSSLKLAVGVSATGIGRFYHFLKITKHSFSR